MLDEACRESLAQLGVVKFERLIPESVVAPARELVYGRLTAAGAWRDGAWTGPGFPHLYAGHATPDSAVIGKKIRTAVKQCAKSSLFKHLITPDVLDTARALIDGQEVSQMMPSTQLLFTPPGADEWRVPHNVWHLDVARLGELGPPGVQMFTFLDSVEPRAGGTLLVAGSHRLLNDVGVLGSKEVKKRLKRKPFFRELMDKAAPARDRFMAESVVVDGVPVRVVELTGAPGDVYFTDLRLLHSLGPNTGDRPRLMVTQRFARESVAHRIGEAYAELAASRKSRGGSKS